MSETTATSASTWEGWTVVIERAYPHLLAYAYQLTNKNLAAAEDIVQEAVRRVWEANPTLRDTEKAHRYLRKAVFYAWCTDWRKRGFVDKVTAGRQQREVSYSDEENKGLRNKLVDPAGGIIHGRLERDQRLRKLLSLLPPMDDDERNVFIMHLDGMTRQEMADALGKDKKTVDHLLNTFIARVKSHLKRKKFDNKEDY